MMSLAILFFLLLFQVRSSVEVLVILLLLGCYDLAITIVDALMDDLMQLISGEYMEMYGKVKIFSLL